MTKSIFQNIEIVAEKDYETVVADFQAAWGHIESFYTKDVKPIVSSTLQYIETNGAADLLAIAKRVMAEAITDIEDGSFNLGQFIVAAAGTVIDEAKSAGIAIEEGAAHLATTMAYAEVQTSAAAVNVSGQASISGNTEA